MTCKICGGATDHAFTGKVLNKYDIQYLRCTRCGFVQTEEPYWLNESYSDAISDLDLGPINRAVTGSQIVEGVILTSFDPGAKYIDWGGGYGVFTRLMRDVGYDFYWRDLYCDNIFAKHFEASPDVRYELLTAFEVFEHLVQPVDEIAKMLEFSDNIFFSTLLAPPDLASADQWWYVSPDHGQHISFYSPGALAALAERFGLHLLSDGTEMHLLSKKQVSPRAFKTMVRNRRPARMARRLLRRRFRKESLLLKDFRAVTGWTV